MKFAFSFLVLFVNYFQGAYSQQLTVQCSNSFICNSIADNPQAGFLKVENIIKPTSNPSDIQAFNFLNEKTEKKDALVTVGVIVVTGSLLYLLYEAISSQVSNSFGNLSGDGSTKNANYLPGFIGLGVGTVFIIGGAKQKKNQMTNLQVFL